MDWRPDQPLTMDELQAYLGAETPLSRNPASRFSFIEQAANAILLFVDGKTYPCAGETMTLAKQCCQQDQFILPPVIVQAEEPLSLLLQLYNQGSLIFVAE